jgi:hypothetical protein
MEEGKTRTMKMPSSTRVVWIGAACCVLTGLGLVCLPGATSWGGCGPSQAPPARTTGDFGLPKLEQANDLALLPHDVTGFISVRMGRLLGKLGLKEDGGAAPFFKAWKDGVGMPLSAVERFTFAATDLEGNNRLLIIQTRRPINQAAVLKACVPGAIIRTGVIKTGDPIRDIHSSEKTGLSVCFASKNLVVVANDLDTMQRCLPKKNTRPQPALKAALERAAKCDLLAWGLAKTPPVPSVPGSVAALKAARLRVSRYQDAMRFLPFVPFPMPRDVLAGQVSLTVGEQLDMELRLTFCDEPAASKGVKCVSRLVNLVRAECLSLAETDETPGMPDPLPAQLRQMAELGHVLEKHLQKAQPRTDKAAVAVTASMPFEAKQLWSAFVCLAMEEEGSGPTPTVTPSPGLFFRQASDDRLPPPMPGGTSVPVPPPPPSMAVPVMPPPALTTSAKLTVANVRKEAVLLFNVDPQGELTFVKKVPAGEAVDLKTVTGERWVAVFLTEPYRVKFVVTQPEVVWLVR